MFSVMSKRMLFMSLCVLSGNVLPAAHNVSGEYAPDIYIENKSGALISVELLDLPPDLMKKKDIELFDGRLSPELMEKDKDRELLGHLMNKKNKVKASLHLSAGDSKVHYVGRLQATDRLVYRYIGHGGEFEYAVSNIDLVNKGPRVLVTVSSRRIISPPFWDFSVELSKLSRKTAGGDASDNILKEARERVEVIKSSMEQLSSGQVFNEHQLKAIEQADSLINASLNDHKIFEHVQLGNIERSLEASGIPEQDYKNLLNLLNLYNFALMLNGFHEAGSQPAVDGVYDFLLTVEGVIKEYWERLWAV